MGLLRETILFLLVIIFTMSTAVANQVKPGDIGALQSGKDVRFTIITSRGYYKYVAKSHWQVRAMKGNPPVSMMVFDIPRPGREPANIVIGGYSTGSTVADQAIAVLGRKVGKTKVHRSSYKGWKVFKQYCDLPNARCKIIDALKNVGDVRVGIRFVLPLSKNKGTNAESRGERLFYKFLRSVTGNRGVYKPRRGETFRRQR